MCRTAHTTSPAVITNSTNAASTTCSHIGTTGASVSTAAKGAICSMIFIPGSYNTWFTSRKRSRRARPDGLPARPRPGPRRRALPAVGRRQRSRSGHPARRRAPHPGHRPRRSSGILHVAPTGRIPHGLTIACSPRRSGTGLRGTGDAEFPVRQATRVAITTQR